VRSRLRILCETDEEIASLEAQPTQKLNPEAVVRAPIGGVITQRQIGLVQYINSEANGATNPVYTIAASIDPNTRRLSVRADVENPDGALRPGMFATFSIITGSSETVPAAPQSAIVFEGETARIWVAGDDRTMPRVQSARTECRRHGRDSKRPIGRREGRDQRRGVHRSRREQRLTESGMWFALGPR
jgi:membrane fusion protein, heavy metal efflux system